MSNGFRGEFLWHELAATDPAAVQNFYAKIVGWTPRPYGPPMETGEQYVVWEYGDEPPMGGLMRLPEQARSMGAPPHWLSYIGTPDVDATIAQARELGAKVFVPPTDIPSVGRFSVLADPQGAVFAAFAPAGGPTTPRASRGGLGDWSWHELMTTDYLGAIAFYSALFGWEKTESMDMGAMGIYQMYGWPGRTLGGMFNKPPEVQAPAHWLPYVHVKDVKQAAETIRALGGKIIHGPSEVPGGDWIVQAIDPQGAAFALHSTKA